MAGMIYKSYQKAAHSKMLTGGACLVFGTSGKSTFFLYIASPFPRRNEKYNVLDIFHSDFLVLWLRK